LISDKTYIDIFILFARNRGFENIYQVEDLDSYRKHRLLLPLGTSTSWRDWASSLFVWKIWFQVCWEQQACHQATHLSITLL